MSTTKISPDFTLAWGDFSATSAELVAVSERGLARLAQAVGTGAVSCQMPKSAAAEAERQLRGEGYAVAVR